MQHPRHKPAPIWGTATSREAKNVPRSHVDYQRQCYVAYRHASADGDRERRATLDEIAALPFEDFLPYRQAPSYRGQRNIPGLYYFASNGEHVVYERRIRDMRTLIMLDFDPAVTSVAAQPFAIFYPDGASTSGPRPPRDTLRCHIPSFLARTSSGPDRLVDIVEVPADSGLRPAFERAFDATSAVCEHAGWRHDVPEHSPVEYANVEWLSGFRRTLQSLALHRLSDRVLDAVDASGPMTIGDLLAHGCPEQPAPLIRPIIYHLLWRHELRADISRVLSDRTLLHRPHMGTSRHDHPAAALPPMRDA